MNEQLAYSIVFEHDPFHSFQYFGLQFYGECWSGGIVYDKYGVSPPDSCWKGVGKKWANFVYKII